MNNDDIRKAKPGTKVGIYIRMDLPEGERFGWYDTERFFAVVESKVIERQGIEEVEVLKDRLRGVSQIIVGEIGASGPESAEESAERAVKKIQALDDALASMRNRLVDIRTATALPEWPAADTITAMIRIEEILDR